MTLAVKMELNPNTTNQPMDQSKFLSLGNQRVHSLLPSNKILDWTKFEAFTDDMLSIYQLVVFMYTMAEKIMGKNAGYRYFLFFSSIFQKACVVTVV